LKTFRRVGGSEEIGVDTRIVAATNRAIPDALNSGSFREDLYYRLSVVEIALPPLRDRQCDIPLLAAYFLCQFCEKYQKRCKVLSPETLEVLTGYSWPGNVRELRNVMESLVLVCPDEQICSRHLPNRIAGSTKSVSPTIDIPIGAPLAQVERVAIERTLEALNHNKSEAARVLGVSRKYLYSKLEEYDRDSREPESA
jgi:two-component system, NtrC family, response regulator HydG